LEIPNGLKLDPVAVAREAGKNINDFLIENPIDKNLTANLHPLSYSNLPELVRANKQQIDREQNLNIERDRSRGLSL
jgi:hypothetical protein